MMCLCMHRDGIVGSVYRRCLQAFPRGAGEVRVNCMLVYVVFRLCPSTDQV